MVRPHSGEVVVVGIVLIDVVCGTVVVVVVLEQSTGADTQVL